MLHIVHLIERRHGHARGASIALRLVLASALLLALGLGLLLSGRALAQDAAASDPAGTAIRLQRRNTLPASVGKICLLARQQ